MYLNVFAFTYYYKLFWVALGCKERWDKNINKINIIQVAASYPKDQLSIHNCAQML